MFSLRNPVPFRSRKPCACALFNENGMTLLELLVVVAILGLLATLGSLQVMGYLQRARADTARLQLGELATALDLYRMDVGLYPEASQGLAALLVAPEGVAGWRGPYLKNRVSLNDPWSRPYRYEQELDRTAYRLASLGADGRVGGEGENADVLVASGR